MEGIPLYLGRVINPDYFRVFIYDAEGVQKLVNSWNEYQEHMQTGLWFAELKDIPEKYVEQFGVVEHIAKDAKKRGK